MKKDYDKWNEHKKLIDKKKTLKYIKKRQIWYVKLWINIWDEENWKDKFLRPFLVMKNIWSLLYWVPLSTQEKKDNKFYYLLEKPHFKEWYKKETSSILLSQAKVLDKKRFIKLIWKIEKEEYEEIKKLLHKMYL